MNKNENQSYPTVFNPTSGQWYSSTPLSPHVSRLKLQISTDTHTAECRQAVETDRKTLWPIELSGRAIARKWIGNLCPKLKILIRGIVVAGAAAVAGVKFLIANLDKVYLAGRRGRGGGFQYIKEWRWRGGGRDFHFCHCLRLVFVHV